MCARVTLASDVSALKEAFPGIKTPGSIVKRYNVAPSQDVAALTNADGMLMVMLRWGLIPRWAKDTRIGSRLINARSETLTGKPSFREAYYRRRCVIIADGFYEWRKTPGDTKIPVYVHMKSGLPFGIAGLWDAWEGPESTVRSCTVITTAANEIVSTIHDRMPVILDRDDIRRWLDPKPVQHEELSSLLTPFPADGMEAYEVSRFVNDPRNDSARCIEPVA